MDGFVSDQDAADVAAATRLGDGATTQGGKNKGQGARGDQNKNASNDGGGGGSGGARSDPTLRVRVATSKSCLVARLTKSRAELIGIER